VRSISTDTIVAVATPRGLGGVGIIRISGDKAHAIAQKITGVLLEPRKATSVNVWFGFVCDNSVAIFFKNPKSFTGEDVVELQMHGGQILLDKTIEHLISLGCRLAEPGEFTRRALLGGRVTLSGAEAIANIIHAESEAELGSAYLHSEFHDTMIDIEKKLLGVSALIEAHNDHPEDVPLTNVLPQISECKNSLLKLNENQRNAEYIYNGIRVAFFGAPNVGKSSIFNAILGTSRSIVTDIAGTTTDTISEAIQIEGYKVVFLDTAGLRSGGNKIEKCGQERTRKLAEECDVAIVVTDTDMVDKDIMSLVKSKVHIVVRNKCDTTKTKHKAGWVYTSAKTGEGIDTLKSQIIEKTVGVAGKSNARVNANMRQREQIRLASESLDYAISSLKKGETIDLVGSCVSTGLFHISNVTGTNTSEAVLDTIFSRFCLGK